MVGVNKAMPWLFPLVIVGILVFYYLYDPFQGSIPIRCPWNLLTGTQCPACGFQRALYTLLHGDFRAALSYNYFFVLSIPYALLAVAATWYNPRHALDRLKAFVYHRYTLCAYIILYLGWWVTRNLLEM